jgi:hypothetical protein
MRTDVTFESAGIRLAGHLYIPDAPADGLLPALVVGHPGSAVKEQASGLYARRLAAEGFVTLAYDAAYQGESGGEPRGLEDPAHRVEDIKAAASFLTTCSEVDTERIGALGICASGGYVLSATASDHRIKAVGTVSASDLARHLQHGGDGSQDPSVFQGMLDAAAAARNAEARGEEPGMLRLFPDTIEQARELGGDYAAEGFEYYCTPRAQRTRSMKEMAWKSIDRLATFDAFAPIALIAPRPLLMVVGTRAVTSWMSIDAFQRAVEPKELYWIDGASHVDLYDMDQYVTPTIAKLTAYFHAHLAETKIAAQPAAA